MSAPHLARARAAEREVRTAVLDEPVDLVEKLGHLLHFVDDDEAPATLGGDLLPQELGVLQVAPVLLRSQEIDPLGVGVDLPQEGCLAALARPPQKEALGRGGG